MHLILDRKWNYCFFPATAHKAPFRQLSFARCALLAKVKPSPGDVLWTNNFKWLLNICQKIFWLLFLYPQFILGRRIFFVCGKASPAFKQCTQNHRDNWAKSRNWIPLPISPSTAPWLAADRHRSAIGNGCDPVNTSICHFMELNILYSMLCKISFFVFFYVKYRAVGVSSAMLSLQKVCFHHCLIS